MKVIQSSLAVAALALCTWSAQAAEEMKQVLQVQGSRALFEAFYETHKESLDLWSTTSHADGTIEADVYGLPSVVHAFQEASGRLLRGQDTTQEPLRFLATAVDSAAQEKIEVAECQNRTTGYLDAVDTHDAPFTASQFHDCWRTSSQIFEFLDKLTALAPQFMTKTASIGTTFNGVAIPVYKISTGNDPKKQALVGQSLIHSREWQSGGTVFYIISGLLDALRSKDARVTAVFDKYDWYFVPILNIDGYDYTWTDGNRYWRKNRRVFTTDDGKLHEGVDLNRNFGPVEFFDLTGDSAHPDTEIYPGTGVLSEPEALAVFTFLRQLPNPLAGLIDVHMNSQSILRPFSNQVTEAPEPYKTKLADLGEAMQLAIQEGSSLTYRNVMGGTGSYLAYGTFKDAVYMEFDHVPAYTLELERAHGGFISSQTTIRDVGNRTMAAFLAFSEGISAYQKGVKESSK